MLVVSIHLKQISISCIMGPHASTIKSFLQKKKKIFSGIKTYIKKKTCNVTRQWRRSVPPLISLSRALIFSLSPPCAVLSACKCPICSCSSTLTRLTSATFSWSLPASPCNNTPPAQHHSLFYFNKYIYYIFITSSDVGSLLWGCKEEGVILFFSNR